ncbi:MAG: selenocysteine-specific translation elongation factor, partial [Thermoanaerobaculia bacterium]|nr:selenocysteine-specific translation elongation factor [Thermoanaerobaculia bacterium]
MRRLIVGTAGHIDHGKTKLVEAITGIDCDRWEEERRRGITIDLGFAHLRTELFEIGFIDVPGHERFLHNALAGLGGIRIVLLVVAADEGIEPQTLEHLEICSLLSIPHALVAVTKSDLVGEELLDLARLEVAELLESSPWPEADIVTVSARSGEGVDELVERLLELAEELPEEDASAAPVRLPIDRAFQLKGLAAIATGTLVSGRIDSGQSLRILPGGEDAKVRSIQVHGEDRPAALAGERTAVQLSGVGLAGLERGQQIVEPEAFEATTSLLARFELLPSAPVEVSGWTEVRFHLYSSEVLGRLRPLQVDCVKPGESAVVELRLAAPVVAVRGDRFVVRRPSPAATLGGGRLLDPHWSRPAAKRVGTAVERLSGELSEAIVQWVDDAGLSGAGADGLARRLGSRPAVVEAQLDALDRDGRLLRFEVGPSRAARWILPGRVEELSRRTERLLSDYLSQERLAPGMPKAEAVRRLMPRVSADLAAAILDRLEAAGVLEVEGDLLKI